MPDSNGAASRPSSSISSTLLDQLRLRQTDAWQRFVHLYSPLVYRWCRRSGVAAEDAADLLQEVLAAVLRHLADFRRDRPQDSFTAWLAAITRSKVGDYYRRRHGRAEARGGTTAQHQMAQIPSPPEPSAEVIQADADTTACLSRRVLEAIRAQFEPRTWEAFWRVTVQRESPADVAEDLHTSVAAVYTAKSRVLRRLRQTLGDLPQ